MHKEKEEKIIHEIAQDLNEKYEEEDGEDEQIEQEIDEITKQAKARFWKESKQMLLIIIPILIIGYFIMRIFFN